MTQTLNECLFQCMRKRTMPQIMHENGCMRCNGFPVRNFMAFIAQYIYGSSHQVKCTEGVLKSCMHCSRIHQGRQTQLFDASKSLDIRVLNQLKKNVVRYADESVNGVIHNFSLVVMCCCFQGFHSGFVVQRKLFAMNRTNSSMDKRGDYGGAMIRCR